ncbi:MAG: HAMP domain-containing histidine kinase [Cytophagaceae bacterium]|jgi:hypothetical protein|nr:HAMP domain-containing histidine kinase [Cytophagaceae bacterium]
METTPLISVEPYLEGEKKRQRLLSKLIKVAVLLILLSSIPELYYGIVESILLIGITLVIFAVAYYLNKENQTDIAANIIILSLSLLLFVQTLQLGTASFTQVYYLPLVTGIPFILDTKKKVLFIFHLAHVVFFCLASFIIEDVFLHINPPLEFTDMNGPINMLCALFMSAFFMWSMIQDTIKSQSLLMLAKQRLEQRNDSLTKSNQELDHLVYSISHDLRAPIATALGLIEVSRLESDPEKLRYYESLKESSLKRLDNFIIDILNYLKNNRMDLSIEPIDIQAEIQHAIQMNALHNSGVDIKVEEIICDGYYSDRNRIRIILNNLISNALKYTREEAQPKYLQIKPSYDGTHLKLVIQDNGVGIHSEYLDKIFLMFFKTDEKSKGSGIGLYITKEAVNKIFGTIEVESKKM